MSEKLLVTADIQAYSFAPFSTLVDGVNSRLQDCLRVMDQMVEVSKDCFGTVVAGDIFDKVPVPPEVFNPTYSRFEQLADNCEVFCVAGNHDFLPKTYCRPDELSFLKFVKIPRVYIFECNSDGVVREIAGRSVSITGFNFRSGGAVRGLLDNGLPKDLDLLVLHDEVKGAVWGNFIFPTGLEVEYLSKLARWVIVGHVHASQQFQNIIVPGSPLQHKFGEDHEKYLWLWDVGKDTWEKIPTKFPRFITVPDESEKRNDGNFYRVASRLCGGRVEIANSHEAVQEYCVQKGREELLDLGLEILNKVSVDEQAVSPSSFQLESVSIQDFLSVGNVELDLSQRDGVWLVVGSREGDEKDSNGVGKTSLFEAVFWGLYGRTTKGLKGDEVVRDEAPGCKVVLELVNSGGNKLIITRTRTDPELGTTLLFDHSGTVVQHKRMDETQKSLESYLGVPFSFFLQMVYFSQEKFEFFSEMTDSGRKGLLSDLLGLGRYELAKAEVKGRLDSVAVNQLALEIEKEYCSSRLEESRKEQVLVQGELDLWERDKEKRLQSLRDRVADLESKIASLQDEKEAMVESLSSWVSLERQIKEADSELEETRKEIDEVRGEKSNLELKVASLTSVCEEKKKKLQELGELKEGCTCEYCGAEVTFENKNRYAFKLLGEISSQSSELDLLVGEREQVRKKLFGLSCAQKELEVKLDGLLDERCIFQDLEKKMGVVSAEISVLARELWLLGSSLKEIESSANPHQSALRRVVKVVHECESELEDLKLREEECCGNRDRYSFWVEGFGVEGIPALLLGSFCKVFTGTINEVLGRIGQGMLAELSPNTVLKKGDHRDRLDYRIVKNGRQRSYKSLSGGEKSRVDIAGVLTLNNILSRQYGIEGGLLGILVLDEVFGSLDELGKDGVRSILDETEARNVFVITHDPSFKDLFNCTKVLRVDLQEDVTCVWG